MYVAYISLFILTPLPLYLFSSQWGFSQSWRNSVCFQRRQMQPSKQLCMTTTWANHPTSSSQKGGRKELRPTLNWCTMPAL